MWRRYTSLVTSIAYHPNLTALLERDNGMLKRAITLIAFFVGFAPIRSSHSSTRSKRHLSQLTT